MNALLDLKGKSARPIHKKELRRLTQLVLMKVSGDDNDNNNDNEAVEDIVGLENLRRTKALLVDSLEKMFLKITNSIKSDAEVWDIYSYLQFHLGQFSAYFESRMKQVLPYHRHRHRHLLITRSLL